MAVGGGLDGRRCGILAVLSVIGCQLSVKFRLDDDSQTTDN
jgi:hypothetical protein